MTTYGAVNGLWTAGNYGLNTVILRNEWGFEGFTMTDWWANVNVRGGAPGRSLYAPMAAAQNDVYMVCSDCTSEDEGIKAALADGSLTRAELQRNAKNILSFILGTNAMKRLVGEADRIEIINRPDSEEISDEPVNFYKLDEELTIDIGVKSVKGQSFAFALIVEKPGWFEVTVTASSTQSELAQIPVTLFFVGTASGTFTWSGTNGEPVSFSKELPIFSRFTAARLYFAQSGLDLHSISFRRTGRAASLDMAFVNEER